MTTKSPIRLGISFPPNQFMDICHSARRERRSLSQFVGAHLREEMLKEKLPKRFRAKLKAST